MSQSFDGSRSHLTPRAVLFTLFLGAVWSAAAACGGPSGASCDTLCANAYAQCSGGDVDSCVSSCRAERASLSAACSARGDAFMVCLQQSSDLDCTTTPFTAVSCSRQQATLDACTQQGGGTSGTFGGGGSGSVSSDGGAGRTGTANGGTSGAGGGTTGSSSGTSRSGTGGGTTGSSSGTSRSGTGGGTTGSSSGPGPSSDGGAGGCSNLPVTFGGGPTSVCSACAGVECCAADQACGANADCLAEINCISGCAGAAACITACQQAHPTGDVLNAALLGCVHDRCPSQCGEPNPCLNTTGFGYTCGSALTGGASNRVYLCSSGQTFGSVVCPNGCHPSAAGVPDYCMSADPCANNSFLSLTICGALLSPNANQNALYRCSAQTTASATVCPNGCVLAPVGQVDHCR